MRAEWTAEFPLRPGLVMFNHASYGLATRDLLDRAEQIRRELESDPNVNLGEALQERLGEVVLQVAAELGVAAEGCALTTSATAGAAALQRSLPLRAGEIVVTLDCEYSSVLRGWRRRCTQAGAQLRVVPVGLPLTDIDALLERMSRVGGDRVAVLQFSAITSSAALRLPIARLAAWGHDRGATVIVDAAHAPGQVDVAGWEGVDAAFGTVHKWFPVPRSVGVLWATPELAPIIRPAETSLTYDDGNLARRFGWPGTFDPAARLCLPEAIARWSKWVAAGEIQRCERLADYASQTLTAAGAIPTSSEEMLPPRMRAFLLPNLPIAQLRQRLLDAGLRAWSGDHDGQSSLLRLATHVYNDEDDVDAVAQALR